MKLKVKKGMQYIQLCIACIHKLNPACPFCQGTGKITRHKMLCARCEVELTVPDDYYTCPKCGSVEMKKGI